MKKIIFFTLLASLILLIKNSTLAVTQETTDSPTPTTTAEDSQLNELKEKIASKVAQLKLTEKRGVIGSVVENTSTQITIIDSQDNQRFIDVDELTKFSSPSDSDFGVSDIEKGDILGILGIYNKQSRRILAREINLTTVPKFINGVVSSIDKESFSISITTESKKEITVDVENVTRTFSYTSDKGLAKSGFSKIEEKENILLVGYQSKTDKDRVTASRIILLPEIPVNPSVDLSTKTSEKNDEIIPSTGSGKKLTPITN